jgi:hypothetical protein
MTLYVTCDDGAATETKLPRRDWLLLPLLGLLTISLIAGSTELIARRMFSESLSSLNNCLIMDDPATGVRAIPNSTCLYKMPESQPIEYRFNSSGYRADSEYAAKAPGTYRIVMAGSSMTMGWGVQREQTFAALLPSELSRKSGHKVELYNNAMMYEVPNIVALHLDETLAAKPDMILWIVTYWDIEYAENAAPVRIKPLDSTVFMGRTRGRLKEVLAEKSLAGAISHLMGIAHDLLDSTKTKYLLQHLIDESQSQYVESHLQGPEAEFLRAEQSAEWQSHLRLFESYAAEIEERARAAGVPMAIVLVPWRVQAAMLSMDEAPKGYDPYKLDGELRAIVTRHGGTYLDILPDFLTTPNPEQHYFPVDGHPDARGHAMIADFLARELTRGSNSPFPLSAQPQAASERTK